jgi:Carboxypeptidase regulatory-like domain
MNSARSLVNHLPLSCIRSLLAASLTLCTTVGFAQDPGAIGEAVGKAYDTPGSAASQSNAVTGSITGRVICADTNGPARFAKVYLKSVVPTSPDDDPFGGLLDSAAKAKADAKPKPKLSPEDEAQQEASKAASAKLFATIADMMIVTTVSADGIYLFTNVQPGTYYVHATVAGYIDPFTEFSSDDLASKAPEIRQKIAAVTTIVTVAGNEGAHADLRMERGAAVSGRVLYDDGTPAAGWTVRTVHQAPAGSDPNPLAALGVDASDLDLSHVTEASMTDDTGHYRIAGLPSGNYTLQARFVGSALGTSALNPMAANPGNTGIGATAGMLGDKTSLRLSVYSGDTLQQADAKPVSLRAGDDRQGYDLTMPLHSLHSVTGKVVSKADAHPINSGGVELTGQTPAGKDDPAVHYTASIRADGTFRFDYVPGPMTYTLKTSRAQDVTTTSTKKVLGSIIAEQKTLKRYGPATATVQVGDKDTSDVTLTVPEMPATSQPAD